MIVRKEVEMYVPLSVVSAAIMVPLRVPLLLGHVSVLIFQRRASRGTVPMVRWTIHLQAAS